MRSVLCINELAWEAEAQKQHKLYSLNTPWNLENPSNLGGLSSLKAGYLDDKWWFSASQPPNLWGGGESRPSKRRPVEAGSNQGRTVQKVSSEPMIPDVGQAPPFA